MNVLLYELPLAPHSYKSSFLSIKSSFSSIKSSFIKSSFLFIINEFSFFFMNSLLIHHFKHSITFIISASSRFLKSMIVKLHLQSIWSWIDIYLLNTLFGSIDIEETEKTLKAIHANIEYFIALHFYYFKSLNTSFAIIDFKIKIEMIKYHINSSIIYCISSNCVYWNQMNYHYHHHHHHLSLY